MVARLYVRIESEPVHLDDAGRRRREDNLKTVRAISAFEGVSLQNLPRSRLLFV
jgi:hypothetical protein